eukprot:TRINITY_DN7617_c0_g1_i1.p1 TRINITY_DN7617_c0_g1~~TRINITY_DN7617_c0_g1_i1.p1  ORF type:complete len:372 (+),score=74.38 TRINITY_DN7617_c0_g1_i1:560-1675(+)
MKANGSLLMLRSWFRDVDKFKSLAEKLITQYEQAITSSPEVTPYLIHALLIKGNLQAESEDLESAQKRYQRASELASQADEATKQMFLYDSLARLGVVSVFQYLTEFENALNNNANHLEVAQRAFDSLPSDVNQITNEENRLMVQIGRFLLALAKKEYRKALHIYNDELKDAKNSLINEKYEPLVLFKIYQNLGREADAINSLSLFILREEGVKLLKWEESLLDFAVLSRGLLSMETNSLEAAKKDFENLIQRESSFDIAHYLKAKCALLEGDNKLAIHLSTKSLMCEEPLADAHQLRSLATERLNELDLASIDRKEFERYQRKGNKYNATARLDTLYFNHLLLLFKVHDNSDQDSRRWLRLKRNKLLDYY